MITCAPLAAVALDGKLTATPTAAACTAGGVLHPKERMRLITVMTDKMCLFIHSTFLKNRASHGKETGKRRARETKETRAKR